MRPISIFFPSASVAAPRWLGRVGDPLVDAGCSAVVVTGSTTLRKEFDPGPAGLARITADGVVAARSRKRVQPR